MSYRDNSVISFFLQIVENKFKEKTGVEPEVDSQPYANWDFAYDFSDRKKPKLYLYSGLGALGKWSMYEDPRWVKILDEYLPEAIKIYKKGEKKSKKK
jgi:hypothetical protein